MISFLGETSLPESWPLAKFRPRAVIEDTPPGTDDIQTPQQNQSTAGVASTSSVVNTGPNPVEPDAPRDDESSSSSSSGSSYSIPHPT